ncbi:MAG: type II secretion system protein [Rhodocyclaceae bacterium]|nr:type II secretion system protein [Rhodocyclaceae bacterium]
MGTTAPLVRMGGARRPRQRGFTYVIAMFAVAVLSLLATRAVERASTVEQRAKEEQLIWVGNAYRKAIEDYYRATPGFEKRYPPNLQALLLDERTTRPTRPLRKLYVDPLTLSSDWGLIKADDGGISGIHSLAIGRPIKADGFLTVNSSFRNAETYQDWKFVADIQPVTGQQALEIHSSTKRAEQTVQKRSYP